MTALPALPEPAQQPLFRTVGGHRLHIGGCPHLLGAPVEQAAPADLEMFSVCHWCRQELDGVGRTYFDNVDAAMRFFGTHAGTEKAIRASLRFVKHDQVWVPNSRAYIALGRDGAGVAWVGKTYVVPAHGRFVELPNYRPGSGGGAARPVTPTATCPVHHIELPATRLCDDCA